MNIKLLSFGYLPEGNELNYCPYCIKELAQEGKDYKEIMKPLKWVKTAEPIKQKNGTFEDYIEKHYECGRCHNSRITEDTFSNIYGDKTSVLRSKRLPIDGVFDVWSEEEGDYIKCKWNHLENKYEPVQTA